MGTYLITGASSGIGAATALRLDADGHEVLAGIAHPDHGAPALAGASQRLRTVVLDVTDAATITEALAHVSALDGVVNNAGVGIAGPLETLALDDLRHQLEVNVIGQVAVTQHALPLLRRSKGRVVFVGSVGGVLAFPFAGAYHASKFAMEAIADVWRQELEPEELAVVLIEPGPISTPIWDKAIAGIDALLGQGSERVAPYRDRLHAFRDKLHSADEHGAEPEEVAAVIADALADPKPHSRYAVGRQARFATALKPLLPDRIADKLTERSVR